MLKIFSFIFKQKGKLLYAIVILAIPGMLVPQIAYAAWWEYIIPVWNFYAIPRDLLSNVGENFLLSIIYGVSYIGVCGTGILEGIAAMLMSWSMSVSTKPLTHLSGPDALISVSTGWPFVRDLANMFVVLGFVIIGLATILRFKEYEAKKLLPKLIIAALLINFSLVIIGIFIDSANITTKSFTVSSGSVTGSWLGTGEAQIESLNQALKEESYVKMVATLVSSVFFNVMAIIVFLLFTFLFYFRYVALQILIILSPLAFVFYVFPFTKKYFEMWWSNFFGWCFIGVTGTFFLWLGAKVLEGILKANPDRLTDPSTYFLPGIFLIAGFLFSLQTSAMGAGAAIGAAKWTGGKIAGVGAGLAKLGGKGVMAGADAATRGRLSEAGQKISSGVGRTMEALGFRKAGATAQARAGKLGESEKRHSALIAQGDLARVQRTAKGEGVRVTPEERAGAVAALLKTNNLDTSDAKQVAGLNYFQNQGGNLGEYTKNNPLLARYDANKMKKYMSPISKGGKGLSEADAGATLEREAFEKLTLPAMRDMPTVAAKNENFARVLLKNPKRVGKAAEHMSEEKIEAIKEEHMIKTDASGKTLPPAQQGSGVKLMMAEINSLPLGSLERAAARKRMVEAQKELHNNPFFA